MKHSVDRILTTHVGSLPRPPDLLDLMNSGDSAVFEQRSGAERLRNAVSEIVRRQAELGIDVVDDGEYSKPSFVSYINERLGGYEVDTHTGPRNQWASSREGLSFPEFYAQTHPASTHTHMICTGPITYKGHAQLKRDIANLKAALQGTSVEEAFMPAISPSNIEDWQKKRLLQITGGIRFRHRGSNARRIQGDRRCRLSRADRRPASRHLLHSASRGEHRRLPQMG
jgi:5-methyltetrahydropteroyltriglutamate--homocysteine methyltransferase